MEAKQTEVVKIRQVAKEYEKKGYKVVIEPRGTKIPSFIKNYQPDLIATNEKETVIIEVKTRADFATIDKLRDIADLINKKKNWRFELIVTSDKTSISNETERMTHDLNSVEIQKNLKEVRSVLQIGLLAAAFILCWATLESLSRQMLLEDKKNLHNKNSLTLIKTLFSLGYLTRTDYEGLEKLFMTRNQIVHGYKAKDLDKKSVERLLNITQKLLTEKQ
jgi:uncharacterized protein YutE (UPF0331/DUF86 family)